MLLAPVCHLPAVRQEMYSLFILQWKKMWIRELRAVAQVTVPSTVSRDDAGPFYCTACLLSGVDCGLCCPRQDTVQCWSREK